MQRADAYWHLLDRGEAIAIGTADEIAQWRRQIHADGDDDHVTVRTVARKWCTGGMAAFAYVPDRPHVDPDEVAEVCARVERVFGDLP